MEEILREILEELKKIHGEARTQRKIMQDVFHKKDKNRFENESVHLSLKSMMDQVGKMTGMQNPEAKKILNNIKVIMGGIQK